MSLLRTSVSRSILLRSHAHTHTRALTTTTHLLNKGPKMTQGHTTDKAADPGHKDYDVQSASVRAGKHAKAHSEDAPGDAQPIDAARQGQGVSGKALDQGGKSKAGGGETAGKGALMDQIGGQPSSGSKSDVTVGKEEDTAGESWTDAAKKTLQGKNPTRFLHTSAIRFRPTGTSEPSSDAGKASRTPQNPDVEGDQNPHLKHKSPSTPDSGKGNASPDPHLPSKQAAKSSSSGSASTEPAHGDTQKMKTRSFSTSTRTLSVEPSAGSSGAGGSGSGVAGSTPPGQTSEGSKADENQSNKTTSPTSPELGKGNAADEAHLPSKSSDATGAATHGAGSAQGVSQGQPMKPLPGSSGSRSFHTSTRTFSVDPSSKSGQAGSTPPGTKSEATKADEPKSQETISPTSADLGKGQGVSDKAHLGSTSTEATSAATHGAGVGEGVSQGQPKKPLDGSTAAGSKSGPGTGSAAGQKRGYATKPPGGYSKAMETEPNRAGFNAPPTALPSQLDSAYSSSAIDKDTSGLTPSNQTKHSSTATSPPNEALREAALEAAKGDGAGMERNKQPDGEVGKLGNKEAWKHRNVG